MQEKYTRWLFELKESFGTKISLEAKQCSAGLLKTLGSGELSAKTVMVAYGGGKDSSYTIAFVRFVQLLVNEEKGTTFRLRIVTNRHAGVLDPVLQNIDRVYRKLHIYEDPLTEALLVDGMKVSLFVSDTRLPQVVSARNRKDILMTGHLCHGEARPTFCNACNLSMVNSYGLAINYKNVLADVIITGDSKTEIIQYYK